MLICEMPAHNCVRVGSLYIKPSSIAEVLSRSVRLVSFEFDGVVGRSGSCTLLRIGHERYIATTRHELSLDRGHSPTNEDLASVRFATTDNGLLANILVDHCVFEKSNIDEEYHDILLFHVADQSEQTVNDQHSFFPWTGFSTKARRASTFVGCPSLDGVMDYDANHIRLKTAVRDCVFEPGYRTSSSYFRRYSYHPLDMHVDGLSGGAVFSLVGETDYEIVLDGVIVRAGNGNLYVVDADYLGRVASI